MPAMLARIVGVPNREITCSAAALTESGSATSQWMPVALPPASVIALTVVSVSPMSSAATLAPSAASRVATLRPIPAAAPVTTAIPPPSLLLIASSRSLVF
jgi:hypothetical protein